MFMATLDNLVMINALPVIRADLHASVDELAWFINAYTLAFAAFMLPASTLGDRYGRRRVMMAGLAVFTAASAGSALSASPAMLIATRAIQGLGAATVMPLSLTLLAAGVPGRLRSAVIGIWGGVSGLGIALGPVLGGAVVEGISWQAIFWLNVPIGILALPVLRVAAPESIGRAQRVDLRGTVFLGGAVFIGIWGIVHGNDDGWTSLRVLIPLIASAALIPIYVWHARRPSRRATAVLPLRLFTLRGFTTANGIGLMFSIGMFGAVFLLAQYLQIVQHYSPLQAGIRTLPWTAMPMLIAPLAGFLAPRTGIRPLLITGLSLQTGALVWFAIIAEAAADYPAFIPPLALAGVGMGLTFAPMSTAVLDGLAEDDLGIASSANSTLREFGVALGVAGLTAVFLGNGGDLTPRGYDGAIGAALLVGAAAVLVALLIAAFAPGRRSQADRPGREVASPTAELKD
jgi:EmrB/QacA subfamily drug resistance transporter